MSDGEKVFGYRGCGFEEVFLRVRKKLEELEVGGKSRGGSICGSECGVSDGFQVRYQER